MVIDPDDDYMYVYTVGSRSPELIRKRAFLPMTINNPARAHGQLMRSPDGTFVEVPSLDVPALASLGWTDLSKIPKDACDACHGEGTIDGEICWHCEGEQTDPTKG